MKQLLLLIAGILFFNNLTFSQQKNLFKKDSTLFKSYQFNNFELLDHSIFRKKNQIGKILSLFDFDEIFKYPFKTNKSNTYKMPIYKPKGNYMIMLNEIDTTKHYSLRIIKPE